MSDAAKSPQSEASEWEAAAAQALGTDARSASGRVFLLRCRPGLVLLLGAVITVLILNSIGLIFMSSSLQRLHDAPSGSEKGAATAPKDHEPQADAEPHPLTSDEHADGTQPLPGKENAPIARARHLLEQGSAREAADLLEPLADSGKLSLSDRFEASLLLARAHKSLGNQDKAFSFARRAADDLVGDLPSAQLFRAAETLLERGEHAGARKMFCSFLARADKLSREEQFLVPLAEFHVADCLARQAVTLGAPP